MKELRPCIDEALKSLEGAVATSTWESRRRYLAQMSAMADLIGVREPCQELFDAYLRDDRGSPQRRSLHRHCAALVDRVAGTGCVDLEGKMLNPPELPSEEEVAEFFVGASFPIEPGTPMANVIVLARASIARLGLSESTVGQYEKVWRDLLEQCVLAGKTGYDEDCIAAFVATAGRKRSIGEIAEWKWKITRKASEVLVEVANTGAFRWRKASPERPEMAGKPELDAIRRSYLDDLERRNLSEKTICMHDYAFRKMIEFSEISTAEELAAISPDDVERVIAGLASRCNARSVSALAGFVRRTLGDLHRMGIIDADLSSSVLPAPARRRRAASYITAPDAARLADCLEGASKRDKAIVLLSARLGLRDGDIAGLTFDCIDWQLDEIRIVQHKTGEPLTLPLLPEVGNAIMDYIELERPRRGDGNPYVFLRSQAPYTRLTTVYEVVRKAQDAAGVEPIGGDCRGTHLLRRSLARRMLEAQVPMRAITDTLGHTGRESDKPYLSMDERMLRECALDLSAVGIPEWGCSRG